MDGVKNKKREYGILYSTRVFFSKYKREKMVGSTLPWRSLVNRVGTLIFHTVLESLQYILVHNTPKCQKIH